MYCVCFFCSVVKQFAQTVHNNIEINPRLTVHSLIEKQTSVTVLLCGTSGTGKSTLASIVVRWINEISNTLTKDTFENLSASGPQHYCTKHVGK